MTTAAVDQKADTAQELEAIGARARQAAAVLARLTPAVKNAALLAMADKFVSEAAAIESENAKDLAAGKEKGLSAAMLDRLMLDGKRISAMAQALREVALLDDPVGEVYEMKTRPNGLRIGRMRVPIGVIGIIYESRPNVTADAGALCVKSGNAVILRGGSEAFHSNRIIARLMDEAGREAGLPEGAVQLVPTTDRAAVAVLLKMNRHVDLIIPRGGKSLIDMVMENSTIPVIKHYDGNCHVYVDASADFDMADRITVNSKTQRLGVCNAAESLLVHREIAGEYLPRIGALLIEKGVELRGDETTCRLVPGAKPATEDDHRAEFLDKIMSVAVVPSAEAAIDWINEYGSHHTETIVAQDHATVMKFLAGVDSACVHVNCSTRFSDGGEYGMGCEIGISTEKLHARGPMGLRELTTNKFIVFGDGQVRG